MTQPFGKSIQEPLVKRLGHSQVCLKPHHTLHTKEGNLKPLKSRQRYPRWEELRDNSSLRTSLNIVKRIGYVYVQSRRTQDCWISKVSPKPSTTKHNKK